jgi:tetratricopeptide (TPR) repeat protein
MAARVNVKFVIILSAVLVAVCGAGIAGYWFVMNKSGEDYERMGDEALVEGNIAEAAQMYERAVGHEPTNLDWLEKWRATLETLTFDDMGAFMREFTGTYRQVIRQISRVKRDDIEAHAEFLDLMWAQVRGARGARFGAEFIHSETQAIMPLVGGVGGPQDVLLRYRGLVFVQVLSEVGDLSPEELERTEADLRAVLAADPTDGQVAVALTQVLQTKIAEAERADRPERADSIRAEAEGVLASVLEADPDNPWARVNSLAADLDRERAAIRRLQVSEGEQRQQMRQAYSGYLEELDDLHRWMLAQDPADLDWAVVERFRLVDAVIDPEANLGRTIELFRSIVERDPDDARAALSYAVLTAERQDLGESIRQLTRIRDLPDRPLSLQGHVQYRMQVQAERFISEYQLRVAGRAEDPGIKAAAIAAAKDARDRFALLVNTGTPALKYLDGLIAIAEDRLVDAIASLNAYNEDTGFQDIQGLWQEAQVAQALNRMGIARDRLTQLIDLENANVSALLRLATVEESFGQPVNLRRAIDLCQQALRFSPGNEQALSMIERYEVMLGDRDSEDPVITLIFEARRIARGNEEQLGDPDRAIAALRDGLPQHNYDSRLVRELAGILLNNDDLAEARELVGEGRARHPDDQPLQELASMLQADNVTDAVVRLIEMSDAEPVDKLLRKYSLYMRAQRVDEAHVALDEAEQVAPEHPGVIEFTFVRSVARRDLDAAAVIADRAEELDSDGMGGVTFQARLASARGDVDGAVRLFEEATSSGRADSSVWRALAVSQRAAGRPDDAIQSFQRSLEIRPDDIQTINQYIATLSSENRLDEALSEARRLRPIAERNADFLELYLTIEAGAGGPEGRSRAIQQRRRIMSERPGDVRNRRALANLYIEDRQWLESRSLIDSMRAERDSLELVVLDGRWHADQGRVRTPEGFRDGIEMAQEVFVRYIVGLTDDELGVEAYLTLAQFMIQRGQYGVAVRAIDDARPLQDPDRLRAEKLYGDLMLTLGRPGDAAGAFQKVVEAGADDAGQNYRKRLIEMLLRQNDFEGADRNIEALGPDLQEDLTVMLQKTDVLLGRGNRQAALDLLNEAVAIHTESAVVYAKRAQVLLSDPNSLNDALADLETALEIQPGEWRTLRLRAAVYYQLGRVEQALADLRNTIRSNPTLDEVLLGLMIELVNLGRDGEALDAAVEVIDQRTTDTTLMITAGRVLSDRGYWSRAAVLYGRAWDLSQDPELAIRYIDTLVNSDPPRPDDAERVLRRIAELGADVENDPEILIARALIERARERPVRAESFLVRAFDSGGEDPGTRLNWIRNVVRVYEGDESGTAVAFVQQMLRDRPQGGVDAEWLDYASGRMMLDTDVTYADGESVMLRLADEAETETIRLLAHRTLGGMRYEREDFAGAESAWRAGLAAFPEDWEMTNNLAYCVGVELGRPDDGLPLSQRAVELAPGQSQAWDTLAKLNILLGNLDEADAALDSGERYIRTASARVNITLNRARLEVARGRCELARQFLSQARTNSETLPQLREGFASDIAELSTQVEAVCN